MHGESSLDFFDHKLIELYHIFVFLLFSECCETFEYGQTRIYHGCHDAKKYHFLSESDRSFFMEKVSYPLEHSFTFFLYFILVNIEDDDVLSIRHVKVLER